MDVRANTMHVYIQVYLKSTNLSISLAQITDRSIYLEVNHNSL